MESQLEKNIDAVYQRWVRAEERVYFDKIGYMNLGYWKGIEDSIEMAQIKLIETLLGFFRDKNGAILDVACGKGASTKFLTKYFEPKDITAINISEQQLEVCRVIAPECTFRAMDAAQMDFNDGSFDKILCLEAAVHFSTRKDFFRQAYRVLKAGGELSMLDFLCEYDLLEPEYAPNLPPENYLPDLDSYREALLAAGFRHARVEDCTELTMTSATRYFVQMKERELGKGRDSQVLSDIAKSLRHAKAFCTGALIYAFK